MALKFETLVKQTVMRLLPTRWWVKIDYRYHMGRKCDLENPKTFNEKLCWLKVYYNETERTNLVDKYAAKRYVAESIGEEYVIPLLGVWKRFDEIDFDVMPKKFVLKPNHTSGDIFICSDKSEIDLDALRRTVHTWIRRRYYDQGREWEYKTIKPLIFAEKYLDGGFSESPNDYKFLCFNGKPKCLYVCQDRWRENGPFIKYYDMHWQPMSLSKEDGSIGQITEPPTSFNEMVRICEILAKPFPFVRLDFYEMDGKIYFGEFTFCPDSGVKKFIPEAWDGILGDWLELPAKKRSIKNELQRTV